MTDHQNDELDALLRAAAQEYNRPGDTPRDQMWSDIRARRSAQRAERRVEHAQRRAWFVPAVAAAVLIIGIAIGRVYERWMAAPNAVVATAARPDSTKQLAAAPSDTPSASPEAPSASRVPSPATHGPTPEPRHPLPATRIPRSAPLTTPNLSYQLAVVEHLAGTEALLTSFRAAAKRGEVDAQITSWARNLLTTTRLLQSSAAEQDPTMKRLLDDLELVLVQIAQYTSAGPHRAEELELIEHSIERRGVIGKLHTTIPARFAPAGS